MEKSQFSCPYVIIDQFCPLFRNICMVRNLLPTSSRKATPLSTRGKYKQGTRGSAASLENGVLHRYLGFYSGKSTKIIHDIQSRPLSEFIPAENNIQRTLASNALFKKQNCWTRRWEKVVLLLLFCGPFLVHSEELCTLHASHFNPALSEVYCPPFAY